MTRICLLVAWVTLLGLAIIWRIDATVAQNVDCAALVDAGQRRLCRDKRVRPATKPDAGAAMSSTETDLIAIAKKMVRRQLRKPDSARFTMLSIKTAADGSMAVCGMIDSQNDTDGRTGPKPFVFDGQNIYVLISGDGADNGTIHDGPFLDRIFEQAKEAHSKLCL